MPDPQDRVEIDGVVNPASQQRARATRCARPWLGVWFRCCHVYGRIFRHRTGMMYEGACPRCGARVRAMIGEGGVSHRFFKTD